MLNIYRSFLVLIFLSFLSVPLISSFSATHAEENVHKEDIVTGNLICLLPDKKTGSVTPVIATHPCDELPKHAHVIVDTRGEVGQVYGVQGSPEALKRLQKTSNRKNLELKGKVGGNQDAWIITVD